MTTPPDPPASALAGELESAWIPYHREGEDYCIPYTEETMLMVGKREFSTYWHEGWVWLRVRG